MYCIDIEVKRRVCLHYSRYNEQYSTVLVVVQWW